MRTVLLFFLSLVIAGWFAYHFGSFGFEDNDGGSEASMSPALAAIHEAEQITDPVMRCLDYPDHPDFKWPEALVEQLCGQLADYDEVTGELKELVDHGDSAAFEQHAAEQYRAFKAGEISEYRLMLFYSFFNSQLENAEAISSRWLESNPKSVYALTARSNFAFVSAVSVRDSRRISRLSEAELEDFNRLLTESETHLETALQMVPDFLPAQIKLLNVAVHDRSVVDVDTLQQRALESEPTSYAVRAQYAWTLLPRWGGNMQALESYVERAQDYVEDNPKLSILKVLPAQERGMRYYHSEDGYEQAIREFDEGLQHALNKFVMGLSAYAEQATGHTEEAVLKYSQILRFYPGEIADRQRRAYHLYQLGFKEWSRQDTERVAQSELPSGGSHRARAYLLKEQGKFVEALEAYSKALELRPDDYSIHKEIAAISIYNTREYQRAKPHIDFMVKKRPEDGYAWLLLADYLHDQGSSDEVLDTALYNFLKYIDRDNPDYSTYIDNIEAYLQSQRKLEDFKQRIAEERAEEARIAEAEAAEQARMDACMESGDFSECFPQDEEVEAAMARLEAIEKQYSGPEVSAADTAQAIIEILENGDIVLEDKLTYRLAGLECREGDLAELMQTMLSPEPGPMMGADVQIRIAAQPVAVLESNVTTAYLWAVAEFPIALEQANSDESEIKFSPDLIDELGPALILSDICEPVEQDGHEYHPLYQALNEFQESDQGLLY